MCGGLPLHRKVEGTILSHCATQHPVVRATINMAEHQWIGSGWATDCPPGEDPTALASGNGKSPALHCDNVQQVDPATSATFSRITAEPSGEASTAPMAKPAEDMAETTQAKDDDEAEAQPSFVGYYDSRKDSILPINGYKKRSKLQRFTKSGLPVARVDDGTLSPRSVHTSLVISEKSAGAFQANATDTHTPDIRNEIAPAHTLHCDENGQWYDHDWDEDVEDKYVTYKGDFVEAWVSQLTHDIKPKFLEQGIADH